MTKGKIHPQLLTIKPRGQSEGKVTASSVYGFGSSRFPCIPVSASSDLPRVQPAPYTPGSNRGSPALGASM